MTLDFSPLTESWQFLARAAYSPSSQIRARVWTFEDEPVDAAFFRRKIRSAIQSREILKLEQDTDSYRLLYAESDGIPGLIVDRYRDVLVLQSLTAGSEFWKETLADLLLEETGLSTIYERSDADVRELEGLPPQSGVLRSPMIRDSENMPNLESQLSNLIITEHGLDGFGLSYIAQWGRGAMDVDIIDLVGAQPGFFQGKLHALDHPFAGRLRRGDMVGIGIHAGTKEFSINFCSAGDR